MPPFELWVTQIKPKEYIARFLALHMKQLFQAIISSFQHTREREAVRRRLKTVSIRGRMAFAITSLERAFAQRANVPQPWAGQLLDLLWQFVEAGRLDVWHHRVIDHRYWYEPEDDVPNAEQAALEAWLSAQPADFAALIDTVITIGSDELYGGIPSYSPLTLERAMDVVTYLQQHQLPLPDLAPFEKSRFEEGNGWGNRVNRSFFVESQNA